MTAVRVRKVDALIAFIDSRQTMPHAIGRKANDCASYALAAVEAQRGVKCRVGTWSSLKAARRLVARYGSLEAALDAHFTRIAPAMARRGDIAGVRDDRFGIHPMIVEGVTLVGPGEAGNRRLPRAAMTCAWDAMSFKVAAKPARAKKASQ